MKNIITAILFSSVLTIADFAFSYSLSTHENITKYSVNLDYQNEKLQEVLRQAGIINTIISANLAEDDPPNWLKHFYNPATGLGLLGSLETARFRAEGFYNNALYYYLKGNESYAWDQIGHALHLLQDMSVPAHVNGTSHAYHTKHSVGYEAWVGNQAIWESIMKPYIDDLQNNNPYFKRPITGAGNMAGLMEMTAGQTYWGGYDYDDDLTLNYNSPSFGFF